MPDHFLIGPAARKERALLLWGNPIHIDQALGHNRAGDRHTLPSEVSADLMEHDRLSRVFSPKRSRHTICVSNNRKENQMLWTIAGILVLMWLLGFIGFHLAGGLIHILLVIAVIVIVVQLVTGRRAL